MKPEQNQHTELVFATIVYLILLGLGSVITADISRADAPAPLNISPSTAEHVVYPTTDFCGSLRNINDSFPSITKKTPNYWAECKLVHLPSHVHNGYPQSDDHAAFCQSLYLLKDKFKDRFDGLDLQQWPFTPCISLMSSS